MITVVIYDAKTDKTITLDCPEIRKTPDEVVQIVTAHIKQPTDVVIRTYSDIPLNLLGEYIEYGFVDPATVEVIYPNGHATFDSMGVLVGWEYGLFNYERPVY
jgi:hypothetical protein